MIDKYDCIKCEFKRLGLTNKAVADILDISVQNLDYLIKQDGARIHWITLGLISYYGTEMK
jgi:orotate phosphoribosyltransferase-like protein